MSIINFRKNIGKPRTPSQLVDYCKAKDLSGVSKLGIDETSSKKGHNYITVVTDQDTGEVIFVTEGKDSETVVKFAKEFPKHGGSIDNITEISMDMSDAFIKGVSENLQNLQIR